MRSAVNNETNRCIHHWLRLDSRRPRLPGLGRVGGRELLYERQVFLSQTVLAEMTVGFGQRGVDIDHHTDGSPHPGDHLASGPSVINASGGVSPLTEGSSGSKVKRDSPG